MNPGSVFFDEKFKFHDGETGEKLFVVLGTLNSISVVAKTTTKQHGRGVEFGCQPKDRFHNFFLPRNSCFLKESTWICLNEFYELKATELLSKRFSGHVKHVCSLVDDVTRQIQDCAIISYDISFFQESIIKASLIG